MALLGEMIVPDPEIFPLFNASVVALTVAPVCKIIDPPLRVRVPDTVKVDATDKTLGQVSVAIVRFRTFAATSISK